jgi:phospholipid-binding lipoprotein MlaA
MFLAACWRKAAMALLAASMVVASGCATDPYADPRDPLEEYNRAAYSFNEMMDRMLFTPLASGYNFIMPAPVNRGVTNFFDNLGDVRSALNNLLQLKIGRAVNDVGRVAVNSTLGILGFMDVASNMNLPRYNEDFGQTLGVWGFGSGPYIVLPFFGPSTVRDGVGIVVDFFADPIFYLDERSTRWSLWGLQLIDTRADLLNASRVIDQAALDPYSFIRDAYLQRRDDLVHDGNPPE